MSAAITFTLSAPFPLLNQLLRMHHTARKRAKRRLMHEIADLTRGARPAQPFQQAHVLIERHSAGRPDTDGLYAGAKDLIDCLTTPALLRARRPGGRDGVRNAMGLGFVVDDGPQHMVLEVRHVPAPRDRQRTVVTIEEIVAAGQVAA
ncbi:hypothetical protein [Rhizosaccharibacter radicis]|uniref:Uncharacterized protein n=1 Tax=Rhizosaccharibacter radicis TaxID=2782605 RepID=A0ABT1VW29_9PROT|nr:hypothetical protein [Acetobacteraceae bacterium KSS12]